ncbi:DUF6046 domain-containing protein [Pedobacter sp. AW31-3R]|uniref:DUF6046 domain-containing protein n=1 Tax=Pedobacter sp. AW31-3R TaxID=3445781 RepID=UPI003FA1927C
MGNINFNLNELYAKVFGISGTEITYNGLDTSGASVATASALLGLPVYDQVTLKYLDKPLLLPGSPMIDITATKSIVTTPIKGRNGTVKEYISIDDYQINIRGVIINYESDEYPELTVHNLHNIFKADTEMQVTSALLNLLDIHYLVIKQIKFPEVEGYRNMQPYALQCLSDMPLELVIKDAKNQTPN